jgi:hypothetical protein
MKVFLMHKDRDFAPQQDSEAGAQLRTMGPALAQDLELDTLFDAMAGGDGFLLETAKQAVWSGLTDPASIRYRQEILKDCLKNPGVVRAIYRIPLKSIENKHRHWMGIFSRYPSGILSSAVQMLEMFVGLLQQLKQIADEHAAEFESQGFQRFFAMIQQELTDDYFALVRNHLKELKFRGGVLLSAELGKANEGTNYLLHKSNHNDRNWLKRIFARKSPIYSYDLHPRDEAGARALGELRDRGLNLVANAAAQSADHIDGFLNALRRELAFYIGCLNLYEQLAQIGEPIAIPEPAPASERRYSFTGLYDVSLALTMRQKVVGNDMSADGKDLFIITGANQGGKSTFLRSIGLAQLMMQCGMFVAAESFSASVCPGLFTHYKREEDASMKSGKFDEELSRMSAVVERLAPGDMLLFNESFAATNDREGSEVARQIVSALLEKRIRVFFVTHLYEFARGFYERNTGNGIFLRAERRPDGSRSFKVVEGEPLQTSYGVDSYNRIFG